MTLDPLSEVFSLLDVRSAATSRLEVGDAWALRFPAKPLLKFHAVLRGKCWIALPGKAPCFLDTGDTFFLANSPPFILAHDPNEPPEDAVQLFGETRSNLYRYRGDDTVLLGGGFTFGSTNARLLLDVLPPFMLIPSRKSVAPILRSTLEILDDELATDQMGSSLVVRRLADILLVQALRAYVNLHGPNGLGWLGALHDRHVGAALVLMHSRVGHHWKCRVQLSLLASRNWSVFHRWSICWDGACNLPGRLCAKIKIPSLASPQRSATLRKAHSAMPSSVPLGGLPSDIGSSDPCRRLIAVGARRPVASRPTLSRPTKSRTTVVMVNRRFTKRHRTGSCVLMFLLSAFFSGYSTNIKRFA
jgi:cupin